MKTIQLWENRGTKSDKVCIVDDEDYIKVIKSISQRAKWYAHRPPGATSYYAVSGDRRISVHRVVMDPPKGMVVDHINGNALDNRKENLRVCTYSQNSCNKKTRSDSQSGYKGVAKAGNRWRAYIADPETPATKKRNIGLGTYDSPEEAAKAYDKKAKQMYGEFAHLNFPEDKQ